MKKVLSIIKNILVILIVIATVGIMIFTIASSATFDRNDRNIFGFKFFVVQTDSMSATDFSAGDVIISKEVDPSTLKEGDIITFISQNPASFGETVTHKIRRLTNDKEGNPAFITYGTTTDTDDETPVAYPYIVGQYQGRIPAVGTFFMFIKTTPGFIVCIFVPFAVLILIQVINFVRLFRRYKREQSDELKEERKKLEEEKKESAEMLRQLQELQQKLATQQGAAAETKPSDTPETNAETVQTETSSEAAPTPEASETSEGK